MSWQSYKHCTEDHGIHNALHTVLYTRRQQSTRLLFSISHVFRWVSGGCWPTRYWKEVWVWTDRSLYQLQRTKIWQHKHGWSGYPAVLQNPQLQWYLQTYGVERNHPSEESKTNIPWKVKTKQYFMYIEFWNIYNSFLMSFSFYLKRKANPNH